MDDLALVRERLAEARRRGEDFDTAWRRALQALAPLPSDTAAGQAREAALWAAEATRDAWQAAYGGGSAHAAQQAPARLRSLYFD